MTGFLAVGKGLMNDQNPEETRMRERDLDIGNLLHLLVNKPLDQITTVQTSGILNPLVFVTTMEIYVEELTTTMKNVTGRRDYGLRTLTNLSAIIPDLQRVGRNSEKIS
jgi:hypothetical protein